MTASTAPRALGEELPPRALSPLVFDDVLEALEKETAADLGLPWESFIRGLERDRLSGLFYARLQAKGLGGAVPEPWRSRLKEKAARLLARSMALSAELQKAIREFERRGLRCAPMRGLVLAERIHGHRLRPMGDLDLFVDHRDLAEIRRIFSSLGYYEMDRRRGFADRYSYSLKFVREDPVPVIFEPHWSLAYPPFVDEAQAQGAWRRATRQKALGMELWSLSDEDVLFHLCLHLHHRRADAPVLWFYELDRLIRTQSFDWGLFENICEESRLAFLIVPVLEKTQRLFAGPVPAAILERLNASPRSPRAGLVSAISGLDGSESLALFFSIAGIRAKWSYAVSLLLPSPEFMRRQYGLSARSALWPAYLSRLLDFGAQGVRGSLRILRRAPPGKP